MTITREKPLILAVETSGRIGSVGIGLGDEILSEICFSKQLRHSAELFPSIFDILESHGRDIKDISQVYISGGPGSFTGLRISVSMAKMMSYGSEIQVVSANTMEVIAANATKYNSEHNNQVHRIGTVLDAKRKQFYITVFDWSYEGWVRKSDDCLMRSSEFLERFGGDEEPIWLLGEGLVYYKDLFASENVHFMDEEYWAATARGVYHVGRKMAKSDKFSEPSKLVPSYIRLPCAVEKFGMDK